MIMKTIIKELNNLRPTKEQVKDKPAYYAFGYVDAINSAIEVVKNNAVLHDVMLSLPDDYDSGLLNDYGGGKVEWWQDYIREEVARCNGYWRDYLERSQGNER